MNILVCVKQVPGSSAVKVDDKTGLLIRPKKGNKLNPYDLFALQAALDIKDCDGSPVSVLTMGPPQAMEAINECLWMGCDEGFLITDRVFGGADVLATSYTISQGIRKAGAQDLILCGKQTTDGDTAQVGAEVAEHLGIPHLSNVISIVRRDESSVTVKALQENLIVTETLELPCLLCLDADINTPRLPSYKRMKEMGEAKVKVLTFADFEDQDKSHYGLKGSPTQVQKVFPPEKNDNRVLYKGADDKLAAKLSSILKERKFI
ncbi:MAG: electron transfer flavoprotein subunit beta/FixA family protein [Sphaerochaetaceae bacterium]|jgi:electron transfer flavoprotein beta subunit